MNTQYITTDLEITSSESLIGLIEALGEDVIVLRSDRGGNGKRGDYFASFEISGIDKDADIALNSFCDLIESFPQAVRSVWRNCSRKVFDIAFVGTDKACSFRSELSAETVARVAATGASIAITLYPTGAYDLPSGRERSP